MDIFFSRGEHHKIEREESRLIYSILSDITDGFFFVDNFWNVLYWNKAAGKILSRPTEDIINKILWDVFPQEKTIDFYDYFQKSKSQNLPAEFTSYYPINDLWLEVKSYPFQHGLAVYFKDVTRKHKLAQEIKSTKTQQQAIIDSIQDPIWSVDSNYCLLACNVAWRDSIFKITGRSLAYGENVFEGFSLVEREKFKEKYDRALSGERFSIDDTIFDPAQSTQLDLHITFSPIIDSDTKLATGVACYAKDITEFRANSKIILNKTIKLEESERHLKETNKKLDDVLNSSLDLICTTDADGRFLQINNASKYLLGYEPSELIGRHFSEFMHPDDLIISTSASNDVLQGIKITDFRNRYVGKDGKVVDLLWSARWDPKLKKIFNVGRDATEIIQAERIRAESEARFAALVQKGADMVGILDAEGCYRFVSPNVKSILGYDEKDLIGRNAFELIHPEDLESVRTELEDVISKGEIKKVQFRILDLKKNWRWIEVVGSNLLDDPALNGIVINCRDITNRKAREQQLIDANDRFDIVLDITNDIIWEWDLITDEIIKNKNYFRALGYDNAINETHAIWLEKIHPDDRDRVDNHLKQHIANASDEVWCDSYRYFKANGEIAEITDCGKIVKDLNGKPVRMVGSMSDITIAKNNLREREAIIEELTQNNYDLMQFSFIISHNLRAPLSNIHGLIKLIEVGNLDESDRQSFQLLEQSAQQLQETVNDLSDIIIIRNRENTKTEVDMSEIFNSVKNVYLNKMHDISHILNSNFICVVAKLHKPYLESIFINLISNAVKYRSPSRKLEINVNTFMNDSGECVLQFSDNGLGFNADKFKDRIFGMYQRFHSGKPGKGMGLFIVKSQVTAMGGTIAIDSKVDDGTTITIALPV